MPRVNDVIHLIMDLNGLLVMKLSGFVKAVNTNKHAPIIRETPGKSNPLGRYLMTKARNITRPANKMPAPKNIMR